MDKKEPISVTAIICLVITLGIMFSCGGCYTKKKAVQQTNRAVIEHPEVVADIARTHFPCIPVKIDSSGFIQSINVLDSLLQESRINSFNTSERYQQVFDSLANARDSSIPCQDENAILMAIASTVQVENETLKIKNITLNDRLTKAKSALANIKPVVKTEEDSAKIFIWMEEAGKYRELYSADHEWRVKKEKREKGNIVIYIPWWIIIVVLAAGGLSIFSFIKNRTFNILKLFTKK